MLLKCSTGHGIHHTSQDVKTRGHSQSVDPGKKHVIYTRQVAQPFTPVLLFCRLSRSQSSPQTPLVAGYSLNEQLLRNEYRTSARP